MRNILRGILLIVLSIAALVIVLAYVDAATFDNAKITAYCNKCDTSGITRSGKKLRENFIAADPRYWKPGTQIKLGYPINKTVTVEDTGGAIKGRHRFDVFIKSNGNSCQCHKFGVKHVRYYVIKRSNRNW